MGHDVTKLQYHPENFVVGQEYRIAYVERGTAGTVTGPFLGIQLAGGLLYLAFDLPHDDAEWWVPWQAVRSVEKTTTCQ